MPITRRTAILGSIGAAGGVLLAAKIQALRLPASAQNVMVSYDTPVFPVFAIPNPIAPATWSEITTALGPVLGFRGYNGPNDYPDGVPTAFPGRKAGPIPAGVTTVVLSFKPDIAELLAGSLDSAIIAWLQMFPTNLAIYLTAWHEGEASAGQTPANLIAMHQYMLALVEANAPANVVYAQIFESWTQNSGSKYYPAQYPGATPGIAQWACPGLAMYGIDMYPPTVDDTWATTAPQAIAAIQAVAGDDAVIAITETNFGANFVAPAAQIQQFFNDGWTWASSQEPPLPVYVAYYGNSPNTWPPAASVISTLNAINVASNEGV
jgi:hypothetical protein